jgi:hypothetical protein
MLVAVQGGMAMTNEVFRNPGEAWAYLCQKKGIELDDRDEGLDEEIKNRLEPLATSLDEALASATMEAFTRAFFEASSPYIAMFQDILNFFEKSEATKAKEQWTLRVDGFDLGLEHFRDWLRNWRNLGKATSTIPALDRDGFWAMQRIMWEHRSVSTELNTDGHPYCRPTCEPG